MTVAELIEILKELPQDVSIVVQGRDADYADPPIPEFWPHFGKVVL